MTTSGANGSQQSSVRGIIAHRVSPSVYDPSYDVADADLAAIFEAARWAPSAGNSQPWRYLVGRRGDATFNAIVDCLTEGNRRWAPAASVLAVSLAQVATGPDDKKDFIFESVSKHDLGQATAYATLTAHSLGLAVHQFMGFDHEKAAKELHVPDHYTVVAALAIGRAWPNEERDASNPAVLELKSRVEEYDLDSNTQREQKPRKRRGFDKILGGVAGDELAKEIDHTN